MKTTYRCLKCDQAFVIELTESEAASSLEMNRPDRCPSCDQRVGTGPATCRHCGHTWELAFPHWQVSCDAATGDCPACGARYVSLCIC